MSAGSHQASQIRPNLTAKFKELGLEAPHYPFDQVSTLFFGF